MSGCHVVIAAMDASSDGPSKMPQPWAQAYSVPDRFSPTSWTTLPRLSTRWLPCT